MSLASAVVLLQTALSLLVLVNSNPSLPQSMRDNAQQVAQQAIAQATAAIAAKNAPQTNQTSNVTSSVTNQTFTTPSGAVIDASGNVISSAPSGTTQKAGLQEQSIIVQPAPQTPPYVNPFYAQGRINLQADLNNMNLSSCVGDRLSTTCQQDVQEALSQAKNTLVQAKYIVLDNTPDTDINTLSGLVKNKISSIDKLKQTYIIDGSCDGDAPSDTFVSRWLKDSGLSEAELGTDFTICRNLQNASTYLGQTLDILTNRVW